MTRINATAEVLSSVAREVLKLAVYVECRIPDMLEKNNCD